MTNIEFKAELRDPALCRTLLKKIQATHADTLEQTDTYYRVAEGRLKQRETRGAPTEVISYQREDLALARPSRFVIYSLKQAKAQYGSLDLPVLAVVCKTREVYLHSGVRIHLDAVKDLGTFIELEALITPQAPERQCRQTVELLRTALAPVMGEVLSASYAELVQG